MVVCSWPLSRQGEGAPSKEESRGFAEATGLGGGGGTDSSGYIVFNSELRIVFLAWRLFWLDWQGVAAGSTDLGE